MELEYLAVDALTATPMGVRPLISFRNYGKADLGLVGGMAAIGPIRNGKRAFRMHLVFALANYLLAGNANAGDAQPVAKAISRKVGTILKLKAGRVRDFKRKSFLRLA